MKGMRMAAALGAALVLWSGAGVAQNGIPHDVVSGGGGSSSGGSLWLHDTIGEVGMLPASQPGEWLDAGFWNVLGRLHIGPTSAVAIAAFDARVGEGRVTLAWTIGSAEGLAGLNVYRSEGEGGQFARMNDALLEAAYVGEWVDGRVRPASVYRYRLGAVDVDGEYLSPEVRVVTPHAATELYQNFPNPFNPVTTVSFYLPERERVALVIYDAAGHEVRRLVDGVVEFGRTDVVWDGMNDSGMRVGSGVYFCRLVAGKSVITRKLTLLK